MEDCKQKIKSGTKLRVKKQELKKKKQEEKERNLEAALFSEGNPKNLQEIIFKSNVVGAENLTLENDAIGSLVLEEEVSGGSSEDEAWSGDEQTVSVKKRKLSVDDSFEEEFDELQPDESNKRKAAWIDDDDQNIKVSDAYKNKEKHADKIKEIGGSNYTSLLKRQFTAAYGDTPKWADIDAAAANVDEGEDEDALQLGSSLIMESSNILAPNFLQCKWLTDINEDSKEARVGGKKMSLAARELNTIFSPKNPLALVTKTVKNGGVASLFQVTPDKCISMDHVFFKDFKIKCSAFLPDNKRFVLGSHLCRDLFVYDMELCRETVIPWRLQGRSRKVQNMAVVGENELVLQEPNELTLLDLRTFRQSGVLCGPSTPGSFCVAKHGDTIYSHGLDDGKVLVWDVRKQLPRTSFMNEGCLRSTCMAVSPDCRYLACGSDSGIVNIFDCNAIEKMENPSPAKEIKTLVTSVTSLQFNHSSEALVMSSPELEEAVRIVHVPSMRVFSNFPALNPVRSRVLSCAFSPNSGYLAFCCANGRVKRIRVSHFSKF